MKTVIGFKCYDSHDKHHEVTLVGNGDRAHVEAVVARVPPNWSADVAQYLKPFVEGGVPAQAGDYRERLVMWWKRCEVIG